MFARILLPLDGSEVAEMALPYGEELAGRLGSELVLFHIHGPDEQMQHMHQVYLDRLAKTAEDNIRKLQSRSGVGKVTTIAESGEPTANIRNLAATNKVDLIIMTSVSAAGLKLGKRLGSVTDYVCRTVPVPVLLVRPQNARTAASGRLISHLLITLDGSDLSKLALPVGEELACELKARATVFQMANMLHVYVRGTEVHARLDEAEKQRVDDEMLKIETELKKKGLDVTHIVTPGFDAASEIIDLCQKIGIDLVVMSTKGRSGMDRWFFGSVTEKVLRYGETPLLLVPAKK